MTLRVMKHMGSKDSGMLTLVNTDEKIYNVTFEEGADDVVQQSDYLKMDIGAYKYVLNLITIFVTTFTTQKLLIFNNYNSLII